MKKKKLDKILAVQDRKKIHEKKNIKMKQIFMITNFLK